MDPGAVGAPRKKKYPGDGLSQLNSRKESSRDQGSSRNKG